MVLKLMLDSRPDVCLTRDAITALTISLTSALLLVGTSAGMIHLYDIPSHQRLRTISTHSGYSITCLASMLKPPDLIGHISLRLAVSSVADAKDVIPVKPISPFQRTRDTKAREAHDVPMLLPTQNTVRSPPMKHELKLHVDASP
jgi:pre-rRNA-processing protein IPI3